MRAWMIYLATILIALNTQSVRANDDYSAKDKARDLENSAKCRSFSDGFYLLEKGYACFSGDIDPVTIIKPKEAIDSERVHTLYVNSLGGHTVSAMVLGRSIFQKSIKLVLHNACFSSCANYLAPATEKLVVQKGTIFGFHGSVYRSAIDYLLASQRLRQIPKESSVLDNVLFEEISNYPEFYKKQAVDESLYFVEIKVSEQYVTRWFEINRNRELYDNGKCGEIPTVALMAGPKYLYEFTRNSTLEYDWDEQAIKANPLFDEIFRPTYSIIFDNDLFPTMTPEKGEIDPLECFSFIKK